MNSYNCLAASSLTFWLGIRTRQISNCACAFGSFASISSVLVTKFIIHSGVFLLVTPFHPGPTNFSSVNLWQLAHFILYTCSPAAAIAGSRFAAISTFLNFPAPLAVSYEASSPPDVLLVDASFADASSDDDSPPHA